MAGITRTTLAMARNRDLPAWLGSVHPRYRVPDHAQIGLAVVVAALVLLLDVRRAIGFSSFAVLVYYAITNASALTLVREERQEGWPGARDRPRRPGRWLPLFGLVACLVLAATLPWTSVVAGVGVFAVGLAERAVFGRRKVSRS